MLISKVLLRLVLPPTTDYCNTEEGLEGEVRQREAPSAVSADSQMECAQQVSEPQASNVVDDTTWQVSRPSIITSTSIVNILGQLDQGLVHAVEFYDSCKTSVAAMVDGQTHAVFSVPKESLPQVLASIRAQRLHTKSYFAKQFTKPVSLANREGANQAACGSMSVANELVEDAHWTFLEQQLEMCFKSVQENFANMEPIRENRDDLLEDIVDAGMSAIQASMKSDRARGLMRLYESRVRSAVKCCISSMIP